MSDDQLERGLQQMRDESADEATIDAASARAWDAVTGAAGAGCAEVRPQLRAHLDGTLASSRRMLVDDHLGRCHACRAAMADLRGERRVVPMPARPVVRWRRWGTMAAAAAVALVALYAGRDTLDAMLAPGGPRATVVSATGELYRVPGGRLAAGAAIGERELVRTGPGAHAVLRLTDGSTVDVNERTELFATAVWSGQAIHLQRGDVIVRAAKQRRGHLRVLTRDSIASVKGTVFAVSAGLGGSVVSVVEGAVAVRQPGRDVLLRSGQQAASNAALASSVQQAVAWSPDADEYLALLGSFAAIERQLAERFPVETRTASTLLPYLPAGAFVYGAVPNLGGRFAPALELAEQQSSENGAFAAWWHSESGQVLRRIVERLQSVSALLGDEIVFCTSTVASGRTVPIVMARVQPGRRAALTRALEALLADARESVVPYSVSDDLLVAASTPAALAWAQANLGGGARSPFASAIAERYTRGAGWLMAIDAPAVAAMVGASGDDAPPAQLAAMLGMKYVFVEQHAVAGKEENEVTAVFDGGAGKGMASWLAHAGSGGVAEYLPADALAAGYVSMQEPWQLFQEFTGLMTERNPSFQGGLGAVETTMGAGFVSNVTAAFGSEAAFTVNGLSVSGPRWTMVTLAHDPRIIDAAFRRVMDAYNATLGPDDSGRRVVFGQERAGDRVWNTLQGGSFPMGVTWTYDVGYMIAASDRATAERAVATAHGGTALIWSPQFLAQLPTSAGLHPSGFMWLNAKGAFGTFSTLARNPGLAKVLADRDPVLAVFDARPGQIHAASRTRVTGLILDAMLFETLTARMSTPAPSARVSQ